MVVILEGRVDQLEKASERARKKLVTDFDFITEAGERVEKQFPRVLPAGQRVFEGLGKSAKKTSIDTANLAAQFNDIGVQLAGGQSPFLIALQQGTQISQVLGPAGAKGAASALGGAFLSLLNPISLATIAAITLGGTVIQYFSSLISDGEKSEETLKAQAQLIDAVAAKWGEAYPAIKAYNDEVKKAKDQADLSAAIEIVKEDKIKASKEQAEQLRVTFAALDQELAGNNEDPLVLAKLQSALEGAIVKMGDGKDASDELTSAMDILKTGIESKANPAVISMTALLETLRSVAANTAIAVANVVADVQSLTTDKVNPNGAGFVDNSGVFRLPSEFIPQTQPGTPDTRPNIELEGLPKVTGSGGTKTDPFASATQSLKERTEALQAQYDAQKGLNPLINDYGYAVEFAKTQQELLTAAEKAKKEVTPQLAADIDKISAAYARTSAELQKLAEENRKAAEAVQFQKDLVNGALSDMRTALEDGKLTWEDLGNVAVNVLNKIADRLQTMLVDQLFAKGFGGLLGSLGGGSFPAAPTAGLYAEGGYTGDGGKNEAKGIVHGGEYVFSKRAVQQAGGPAVLEAMHRNLKGYANGGLVGSMPRMPNLAAAKDSGMQTVHVVIDDDGGLQGYVEKNGRRTEARVLRKSEAARRNYVRGEMTKDVNRQVRNPRRTGGAR